MRAGGARLPFIVKGDRRRKEKVRMATTELSEKDKVLYDRQIRLWGVEAQKRMQSCFVLVCGLHGLNCEVVKNLVLAGINVMVQDDTNVDVTDLGSNYFIGTDDVGTNIASSSLNNIKLLNNNARVECETRPLKNLSDEWFHQFNVVVLSDYSTDQEALHVNHVCRSKNIGFFWTGTFALEGWYICDLGTAFTYTGDPDNAAKDAKVEKNVSFPSLKDILETRWDLLQSKQSKRKPSSATKTYIQSRILAEYRNIKNCIALSSTDSISFIEYAKKRLRENGLDESFLDDRMDALCQGSHACLIMISSVVGGFLAQEIQKAVSHIGEPHFNVFEFTGDDQIGKCFKAGIHSVQ